MDKMNKYRFRYKLWLESKNNKAFGKGPVEILDKINRYGSLRKAAEEMKMSYSHAWNLLNEIEKRLECRLIERQVGGEEGGGSILTPKAKELMERFNLFEEEAGKKLSILFNRFFSDFNPKL